MAKLKRLQAIILHRKNIREKDRIIEVYSREGGRIRIFVPGVRHTASRRAGHIETLMETKMVIAESSRGYSLNEARVLRAFPSLRSEYEKLEFAYRIVKLFRDFTPENESDKMLYGTLAVCLEKLNEEKEPPPYAAEFAAARVLNSLGLLPDLYKCARCRMRLRAEGFSFKAEGGGLICRECGGEADEEVAEGLTDTVKILRIFQKESGGFPLLKINNRQLKHLRSAVNRLLLNHHGRL